MANKSKQKKKTPRKRYNPILDIASSYRGCGPGGGWGSLNVANRKKPAHKIFGMGNSIRTDPEEIMRRIGQLPFEKLSLSRSSNNYEPMGGKQWEDDYNKYIKPAKNTKKDTIGNGRKRKGKHGKGWLDDWLEDIPFVGHDIKQGLDKIYNTIIPGENEYFGDDSTIGKIGRHAVNYLTDNLTTPGGFIKRVADSDWSDPSNVASNAGSALMDEYYMRGKDPLVVASYGQV